MRDFNHTINVLVKAYLKDELKHGSCSACAVGNIVGSIAWQSLFLTGNDGRQEVAGIGEIIGTQFGRITRANINHLPKVLYYQACEYIKEAEYVIAKTGYTVKELASVELAFESAPKGESEDEWMFNGLMAVVDCLADIHGISLEQKEETKKMFVKI